MSALGEHAARYVAVRRAVGFKLTDTPAFLDALVACHERAGLDHLSVDVIGAWACTAGSDSVYRRRMSVSRRFAAWVQTFDPASEVAPAGLGPRSEYRRPASYLLRR